MSNHQHQSKNKQNPNDTKDQRFISHVSENFVSPYFSAMDSPNRLNILPNLYQSDATLVWNGHPLNGAQVREMLSNLPESKHDVQGFDCQIMGRNQEGLVTSLLIQITGLVTHHTPDSLSAQPPSNAPSSKSGNKKKIDPFSGSDPNVPLNSLPRQFSQSLILNNRLDLENGGIEIKFEGIENRFGLRLKVLDLLVENLFY